MILTAFFIKNYNFMVELFTNFKFRNTNNTCTLIDSYRWFNCRKTIKLQKTLIKTAENRTPFSVFLQCRV